jgi:hypothetical protein
MDIMEHRPFFRPAVARTPGGSDYPVAVAETLAALPPATGCTVGVIDTGLVLDDARRPHPWFGDHVSYGEHDDDPLGEGQGDADEVGYLADADGHGTFVTGLILRGAQAAHVRMCGVLDKTDTSVDSGAGDRGLNTDDDTRVAEAVGSLGHNRAVQVINLSFGGGVFTDRAVPKKLADALRKLDPGIAVVAAAGNDASETAVWPAAFALDNDDKHAPVISVGALDGRRLVPPDATPPRAPFSNHGSWVTAYADGVQVLGPFVHFEETGNDLFGLRPAQRFRGWARWSGTSFAAAAVSGRIARVAMERGLSGAAAARAVLAESRRISSDGAVWVRTATDGSSLS